MEETANTFMVTALQADNLHRIQDNSCKAVGTSYLGMSWYWLRVYWEANDV